MIVSPSESPRRGMTLVDPISVLGGLVVLATLLLPAVGQSREAARRSQCFNNLKQQGLAMHNYEATFKRFPPAMFTTGDTSELTSYRGATTADQLAATDAGFGTTWAVSILPFLDELALWEQVDTRRRLEDQTDFTQTHVESYWCPAAGDPTQTIGTDAKDTLPPGVAYARGSYGINLGGGNAHPIGPGADGDRNGPWGMIELAGKGSRRSLNRGLGTSPQSPENLNSQTLRYRDVLDGTSNTVLIGELRTDARSSTDSRGAWARGMGAVVSAFTRGKPADGMSGIATPNAPTIDRTDPANPKLSIHADCPVFAASHDGEISEQVSAATCDGFGEDAGGGTAIRSHHEGGANTGFADGAARFLSESIDPLTYRAIMTSVGREVVDDF